MLPILFKDFGIKSILDIACGDFGWMSKVDLTGVKYLGADIVEELMKQNIEKYPGVGFAVLDVTTDELPKVDLIMCRDCLVHLSDEDVYKALRNIYKSGAKYVLMTHFPKHLTNVKIPTGSWRTLNFNAEPFNFPEPIAVLNENCTEADMMYTDKSLGLWLFDDIYDFIK